MFALIFAAVAILTVVASGSISLFNYTDIGFSNMEVLTGALFGVDNGVTGYLAETGANATFLSVGMIILLVGAAVCAIMALVGLISGKANLVLAIGGGVGFIGGVFVLVGTLTSSLVATEKIFNSVGLILAIVAALLALVFAVVAAAMGVSGKKSKTKKA